MPNVHATVFQLEIVSVTVFVVDRSMPAAAVAENVYVITFPLSEPLAIADTTVRAVVAFEMSTIPELVPFVLASAICNVYPGPSTTSIPAVIFSGAVLLCVSL